jgi:hypothetical protein
MAPVSSVSGIPDLGSPTSYFSEYENLAGGGDSIFGGRTGDLQDRTLGSDPLVAVPLLNSDWQGYMRNYIDESAANVFANARHAANDKVGLVSVYKSSTNSLLGGEGRDGSDVTFGKGVRSLNLFDLDRLL